MVYKTKRQNYIIILNGNINYETQCKVFLHEEYEICAYHSLSQIDIQHYFSFDKLRL